MSARPRARSARTARTSRTPQHRIPIGLQIAAIALDADVSRDELRDHLTTADRHAAGLLHNPIAELPEDGAASAIQTLADLLGCKDAIRPAATGAADALEAGKDPEAALLQYAVPRQNAGFYLGLCLGFRIAAGLGGKE